jgi:hypothetical protein
MNEKLTLVQKNNSNQRKTGYGLGSPKKKREETTDVDVWCLWGQGNVVFKRNLSGVINLNVLHCQLF